MPAAQLLAMTDVVDMLNTKASRAASAGVASNQALDLSVPQLKDGQQLNAWFTWNDGLVRAQNSRALSADKSSVRRGARTVPGRLCLGAQQDVVCFEFAAHRHGAGRDLGRHGHSTRKVIRMKIRSPDW